MKKIFSFFCFLVPTFYAHATVPDNAANTVTRENSLLFQEIPLLKQYLRPFETISLHVVSEERAKGATSWSLEEEKTVRWNPGSQMFWWKSFMPKQMTRNVSVFSKNQQMSYIGEVLSSDSKTEESTSWIRPYGAIQTAPSNIFLSSRLDFIWFFYDFHIPSGSDIVTSSLLSDSEFLNSKIIKMDDPTVICIRVHDRKRMLINRNTGMITKILWGNEKDGKFTEDSSMEVIEFATVAGWQFPVTILKKSSAGESRQRIDVKSLKINEPLSASDFVVTIPSGTQVIDHIKGTSYVTGRPITSADIADIETQLRALVKKAQESTKSNNPNEKTPQKP
jgi:hypothetical protein